jgi:hypothetical protein
MICYSHGESHLQSTDARRSYMTGKQPGNNRASLFLYLQNCPCARNFPIVGPGGRVVGDPEVGLKRRSGK